MAGVLPLPRKERSRPPLERRFASTSDRTQSPTADGFFLSCRSAGRFFSSGCLTAMPTLAWRLNIIYHGSTRSQPQSALSAATAGRRTSAGRTGDRPMLAAECGWGTGTYCTPGDGAKDGIRSAVSRPFAERVGLPTGAVGRESPDTKALAGRTSPAAIRGGIQERSFDSRTPRDQSEVTCSG